MKSIKWINAQTSLPPINNEDKFDVKQGYSKKCVVWLQHSRGETDCRFARFRHHDEYPSWSVEGITGGNYIVTHYANINEPIK